MSHRDALIKAYEDYIASLGEEVDELSFIATQRGWRSSRVEEGRIAREKIENLKAKIKEQGEESIRCAAIWYKDLTTQTHLAINVDKGIVVCGFRHGHCIDIMSRLGRLRSVYFGPDSVGENVQGFYTSLNRFVSREEAYLIALKANQIVEGKTIHSDRLFSEDLY